MKPWEIEKRIVDALAGDAIADATGESAQPYERTLGRDPKKRFWLGWLAPEPPPEEMTALSERFRPAAHGFSFRVGSLPVTLSLSSEFALWVPVHPTYAEQVSTTGTVTSTGASSQAFSVAEARMKVPVSLGQVTVHIDRPGDMVAGAEAFGNAIRSGLTSVPPGTLFYRPFKRGGRRPDTADLRDRAAWTAWERENLLDPALPRWRIQFEVEARRSGEDGIVELLVTLVNRSSQPEKQYIGNDMTRAFPAWAGDATIFEASLRCEADSPYVPYELEQIPDSYRYDRRVVALGFNTAADELSGQVVTQHAAIAQTFRSYPRTESGSGQPLDVSFSTLKTDPVPALQELVREAERWANTNWSTSELDRMEREGRWLPDTRAAAERDRASVLDELKWIEAGLAELRSSQQLLKAFKLMNESMELAARGRYSSWYPFQIAFILGCLKGVVDPAGSPAVDIVWFRTGGGKTEAYLGLNLVHLFYGRLRGRTAGAQTWARFPLRLLSLQQTQRFADTVLLAEVVRRRHDSTKHGDSFGIGYYVGSRNTPNSITLPGDRFYNGWDPEDARNQESCRVLERCPACDSPDRPRVRFDRDSHTMVHECVNSACELYGDRLPVFIIDDDIYRWAPSVVVGTVDKLAQLGQNASFRILLGQAVSRCPKHGYSRYADRCAIWGCRERQLPVDDGFGGFELEIQDELHLLSESLGALDGNYETLFQSLREELGLPELRIIGATATIEGYKEQAQHLYRREPRRFPAPGPTKGESFWSVERVGDPLRKYVGLLPRGATMLNAAFFLTQSHWDFIRRGVQDPASLCGRLSIEQGKASEVRDILEDLYETMVTYALRKDELERYAKDVAETPDICPDPRNYDRITGDVEFWDVRGVLERLESPPSARTQRVRVLGATSAISHGVDIDRLNTMIMMGMPTQTAEFIQATARVGRKKPAIVFSLINPMRERDVSHYRFFRKYAEYLDRLVEPVPVNRESLPVLKRVLGGGLMALMLQVQEIHWMYPGGAPKHGRRKLWHAKEVARAIDENELRESDIVDRLCSAFAIDSSNARYRQHRKAVEEFVSANFERFLLRRNTEDDARSLIDPPVPRSLRDVEMVVKIVGEE